MKNIKLIMDDCANAIKNISDSSIDLIITSPPYDDLRNYNNNINYADLIREFYRILKQGGVIIWNVNDRIRNGSKTLTSFKQAILFNELGFNVNDIMIWEKTNPMPQVKQPRYNQVFEFMFVFSKGKPKTFNPILVECKNSGVNYNSTCKQITKGKERIAKHFLINKQKVDSNIWKFAIAQNKTEHPAVFPMELPLRHIVTWSNENDTVLDPFMGSGTTGIACIKTNRKFIGIELEKRYFDIAKERIENYYNSIKSIDGGINGD